MTPEALLPGAFACMEDHAAGVFLSGKSRTMGRKMGWKEALPLSRVDMDRCGLNVMRSLCAWHSLNGLRSRHHRWRCYAGDSCLSIGLDDF
jgi:hypothetical protein